VVGPTGDSLAPDGTLYVADTQGNRIAAIPDAPFRVFPARHGGWTVSKNVDLNGPLGMTLAPNGDILTANGDDGNIVETTPGGTQTDVAADSVNGGGALFGLTVPSGFDGVYFVDDATNTLNVLAP
jgi:sugar lactone lactonase YvrE